MNDVLTEDTKAIALLCGVFGQDLSEKPLSVKEYSHLVRWLVKVKLRPSDLFLQENLDEAAIETSINQQRLGFLLGRGVQLGFAIEEWQQNGIWLLSRSDKDYPIRYRKHLKDQAPPLLFGVGNRNLLIGGGLSMVGSRNVDQDGEAFARQVAELCAFNQMPVISGGARGVDQISMNAALEANGVTIGILAENLLKKSLERQNRQAITEGRLLLLSPYHPNARFTVGTAMGRNKLIYAMSNYGLVVSADHGKGGTWAGASEELKRDTCIPIFVRLDDRSPLGNRKLLDLGAIAWPKDVDENNIDQQLVSLISQVGESATGNIPSLFNFKEEKQQKNIEVHDNSKLAENKIQLIYKVVLPVLLDNLQEPLTAKDLSELLDVTQKQLHKWLKKAISENKITKLSKPVRYQKAE